MLSVKNIFAGYGDITVLNDITFDLSKNDILGVLGRNGMGKSTLIRVLSGLIKPSDGTINRRSGVIIRTNQKSAQRPKRPKNQSDCATCSRHPSGC